MTGPGPARRASVELEVPFHDVDSLGIVWHGHYHKYFELARTVLMRGLNLDVGAFRHLGYGLVIVETRCRYVSPLRYGDRVRSTAWLAEVDQTIVVAHDVHNLTAAKRAARGRSVLVPTDSQGKLLPIPDLLREMLLSE